MLKLLILVKLVLIRAAFVCSFRFMAPAVHFYDAHMARTLRAYMSIFLTCSSFSVTRLHWRNKTCPTHRVAKMQKLLENQRKTYGNQHLIIQKHSKSKQNLCKTYEKLRKPTKTNKTWKETISKEKRPRSQTVQPTYALMARTLRAYGARQKSI